jgi:cytochrome c
MYRSRWIAAGLLFAVATSQAASDPADPAMLKLASRSGCLTCHHVESTPSDPNGALPVGPAWESVALRYRGQAGAVDQLTHTVLGGSNPYASHWKGQANGLAMPPNAVAISEPDARRLVGWILELDADRPQGTGKR